jgi:hypothetical protein
MRELTLNVPASEANEEQISGPTKVVRRIEITVKRRVCSIEIHGVAHLPQGLRCPVCGVTFADGPKGIQEEVK